MTATASALERLAGYCGILPAYVDTRGRRHEVTQATLCALLEAMGIDTRDSASIEAAAAARERKAWESLLPPVHVLRASNESPDIPLSVPDALADKDWNFVLTREDGTCESGSVHPAGLAEVGQATIGDRRFTRYRWPLPGLGCGYHHLRLDGHEHAAQTSLIVAPDRCYLPEAVSGDDRVWGPALQLYALRSHRNWGIGDFADLSAALEFFARAGAGLVGVSPLHCLYPHRPGHASPYSPSSRLFWNALYIDIESVPGLAQCDAARARLADPAFLARIAAARDSELVDYAEVAALKLEVLDLCYRDFRDSEYAPDTGPGRSFREFVAAGGESLQHHGLYEALAASFAAKNADRNGWPDWPAGYERPDTPAAKEFSIRHAERVDFYVWLQWLAERQLDSTGRRAAELGLGVGLYLDIPVGAEYGGSEVWARPELHARDATIGSPADDYNPRGQNWGLAPWIPERLIASAYRPLTDMLRRNMRHAGAIRIDHVMSLMRLFWIPRGAEPDGGAYVGYPVDDLLAIVRLESQRNKCMVVGEDLGTVPQELREMLRPIGVLSSRLFYFDKKPDGEWWSPAELPRQAVVAVSNHDLPTLRGYWRGEDIVLRHRLQLLPEASQYESQIVQRAEDRARMLVALSQQALLPDAIDSDPARVPDLPATLMAAIHRYVARSPAMVLAFQMEDALGVIAQINVPGTSNEYPNWRRKLPVNLEQWAENDSLEQLLDELRAERGVAAAVVPTGPVSGPVIPVATYRLQLNEHFTFNDVERMVSYLDRLGVTHCYLSPFLRARPGSMHGYDVIDHHMLNPEIGTRQSLESLVARLREAGMGLIADVVPNHMAVMNSDNGWWLDVLENGQSSQYADYFDIDWQPVRQELRDKVLIPVLGDHYGVVLDRGELRLHFDESNGEFSVFYHEHRLPLDPATYSDILGIDVEALAERLGHDSPACAEYLSIQRAFAQLPSRRTTDPDEQLERRREKEVTKRRLAELCQASADVSTHVATAIAMLAGHPGHPESFLQLHELLERQAWRVAFWQVAGDEINYRRFFDINELASLRVEEPEVLQATHQLIAELYQQGLVDGLRIDHPDGLYDPAGYCARLQDLIAGDSGTAGAREPERPGCYVVVEKILAAHEHLREDWAVYGSTGYDFAFIANALLIDPDGERELNQSYREFTGERIAFDELLYACKRLIVRVYLSSELTMLVNLLNRITQSDRHSRDFTLNGLRDALTEIVACFPVYRTYVTPALTSDEDREYVDWAIAWAQKRDPEASPDLYALIRRLLLLDMPPDLPAESHALAERFAMKFQQYTAPVMAKALEDTCFYRACRLISLNEVGGDPRQFGASVAAFHRSNQERARRWPHGMLAGSTHDNKRSEDVRARLNVLTELPSEWRGRVRRWRRFNRRFRRTLGSLTVPVRRDEYLFYQSLLGIWPLQPPDAAELGVIRQRLVDYMRKAVREAKEYSSWMHPDEEYEAALEEFIRASLDAADTNPFLVDMAEFAGHIAPFGLLNGLTQTALRLAAPGVPDIYQGNELWDFSLVDPDNRRAVDFEYRERLLGGLERGTAGSPGALVDEMLADLRDGRMKLYLTWKLLRLRAAERAIFEDGDYQALPVHGSRADHVCAFARRHQAGTVVILAGRWFARLKSAGSASALPEAADWADTWVELPGDIHNLRNEMTGSMIDGSSGRLAAAGVLAPLPVAILREEGAGSSGAS